MNITKTSCNGYSNTHKEPLCIIDALHKPIKHHRFTGKKPVKRSAGVACCRYNKNKGRYDNCCFY